MIPGLDILLGGITGLIGNAFTTWFKYKNTKMDNEHKEKMVDLETQAMIKESEMQIQVTKARIEGEVELADSAAFDTSQTAGNKQLFADKWIDMIMANRDRKWTGWFFGLLGTLIAGGFALVDWLNGMMRPALTIYLVGTSSYITYLARCWYRNIYSSSSIGYISTGYINNDLLGSFCCHMVVWRQNNV
jgi:hypothetical protein